MVSGNDELVFQNIQHCSFVQFPPDMGFCSWQSAQRTMELLTQALGLATVNMLALDLSRIERCNSQFLGMLIHLYIRAKRQNKGFCVYQPKPFVLNVIKVMGLDEVFSVCQTKEEALLAWNISPLQ